MFKRVTTIALAIMLTASMAFGSGFSIYEHGAKATAMGGAFIAQANDVSSVFYNPAGISSLKGTNFGLGATVIMPKFGFTGPVGTNSVQTDAEALTFYIPHLYVTHELNDQWALGFGVYTMFGLTSEWPEGWVGRELNVRTELKTFFFNPLISFKPVENFSIAVGASLVYGDVSLKYDNLVLGPLSSLPNPPVYISSKLEGSTTGFGFNIGLKYDFTEQLTVGLHYRHNVNLKFDDGEATFSKTGIAQIDGLFPTPNKGKAEIKLPNMIGAGIAYDITEQFTVEFDFMQLGWSSYDKLVLELEQPVGPPPGQSTISSDKKYEDSYSLRLGLEYRLDEAWAIRAGYLRDNNAVPDNYVEPTLPEGKRDLLSLGFGWTNNKFTVDGYFLYLMQQDREISNSVHEILDDPFVPEPINIPTKFNGKYEGSGVLFGVTLGYAIN